MNRLAHLRLTTIWYAVSALIAAAALLVGVFAFAPATELTIYTWEDYIAPEVVASFEETYHVEVSIHEFESEFDLVRAYREQPDLDAYDLIFFSDTVAEELRRLGVLSSIKKNQVPNIEYIAPTLLDTRVNAEGLHAVPYMFGTTGIVYNEKYVDADTVDWSSFWDEQYRGKSCLLNDESEVIAAAALSQGFDAVPTNDAAMREVTALVRQYTENDGTYCGDVGQTEELVQERLWIAQNWNGSAIPALDENPSLAYIIPGDGGRLWYDMMAIPRGAKHARTATLFINFINEPRVAAENVMYLQYASVNDAAREYIDSEILNNEIIYPASSTRARVHASADFPYYEAVADMRDEINEIMQEGKFIE